ncbi:hypothetical protein OIHEL45_09923 [Sulfitobacter indolifex HEL-45]|uniref:Uncharacterized protein n=1 Tax=Sulfitobacter indolifex HEL-45 TaxID=391624 RepID=A0ABM9X696_9RHOB|nr:hypothetical protein OIHEL45_09923 [Sulfitobacter indolifex HEL-45]
MSSTATELYPIIRVRSAFQWRFILGSNADAVEPLLNGIKAIIGGRCGHNLPKRWFASHRFDLLN